MKPFRRWAKRESPKTQLSGSPSLHALAKPFSKRRYNQQVSGFVAKVRDSPLSKDVVETLAGYLGSEHIGSSTKALILHDLHARSEREDEARMILEARCVSVLLDLLHFHDPNILAAISQLLGNLAGHRSLNEAIVQATPCARLVSHLDDSPLVVQQAIMHALSSISQFSEAGARAVVDANILSPAIRLLGMPDSSLLSNTSQIIGNIALHSSLKMLVIKSDLCRRLVFALMFDDVNVQQQATRALACICDASEMGARAVGDTDAPVYVVDFLQAQNPELRKWACCLLGDVVQYKPLETKSIELTACLRLVPLLNDSAAGIVENAIRTLGCISAGSYYGARAVVDSQALAQVAHLLDSLNPVVLKRTLSMLGSIARHESLNSSIVGLHLSAPLVSLLQHKENAIREKAIYALACISKWPGSERGTLATENVSGLYMAMNLLDSPEPDVAKWACWMVGNVVQYEPWNTALVLHLCVPLVSLLAHHGSLVQRQAMYSLGCISEGAEEYARAVVDANVLDHAMGLLQSQDPHMLRWTCWMLGNVARRKSLTASVMALGPCPRLTSLLNHEDVGVHGKAIYALVGISDGSDEGGQAVVDANALDHVFQLLDSPDRDVVKSTCWMLGNIARRQALSAAVVQLNPCARLVSLLEHRDSNVQSFAMYALACISEMSDQGVNAVAEAKALDCTLPLLGSSWSISASTQQWACWMVGNLAAQKSLNATVIDLDLCGRLVSLLQTSYNDAVRENAIYALACISAPSEDGARAVADAKIQDYCKILLESQDTLILDSTCRVLGNLARHEAWHSAVIELGICPRLVSLSEHNDTIVQDYALYALVCISELSEKGARAVADAGALERAAKLLASPDDRVKAQTCCVLGNIGRQESLNAAVVAMDPCMPLVSLLEHDHSDVRNEALYALACISHSSEQGARAVVDAGALAHIVKLLVSQDICVLRRTCWVLRSLASHESLNAMIIELDSCAVLVSLLQHDNTSVQGDAMEALGSLSDCSERGGRAVAGAHTLDHVGRLLQAQDTAVLYCTCWMLGNLAFNEALHAMVLALEPCARLVSLLEHEHARVRENAMYALACISDHSYSGARAVVAAHALDHALTLLASSDAEVKSETCWMVGNVARYPPLNAAVIDLQPCAQLVELLQHEKSEVRAYAMYALACISNDLGAGARAVADADTVKALDIDSALNLAEPPETVLQPWICWILANLRNTGCLSALSSGVSVDPLARLCELLGHPVIKARRRAIFALSCLSQPSRNVAHAVVTNALHRLPELLVSSDTDVLKSTCRMVRNLTSDAQSASYAAVVESNPCMGLLALGNMNDDSDVRAKVLDILESISAGSPTGAQVVADARLRWELPHDF